MGPRGRGQWPSGAAARRRSTRRTRQPTAAAWSVPACSSATLRPGGARVDRGEPFPLRFSDFDVVGHVNNAVYWTVVEQVLARRRDLRAPLRAVVEHRAALERTSIPVVDVRDEPDGFRLWVLDAAGSAGRGLGRRGGRPGAGGGVGLDRVEQLVADRAPARLVLVAEVLEVGVGLAVGHRSPGRRA